MTDLRLIQGGAAGNIALLQGQVWPLNRVKGDFRRERAAAAELELRRAICGHCARKSPPLDGPTGRAWWTDHQTKCSGKPPLVAA